MTSYSRGAGLSRHKQLSKVVSVKTTMWFAATDSWAFELKVPGTYKLWSYIQWGISPRRPGQQQVFFLKLGGGLLHVATAGCLRRWEGMSSATGTSHKLQGSVATYLRCSGVINNQIKKGLLLSLWVKFLLHQWRKCRRQSHSCL